MTDFEKQVKDRAKEIKGLINKGMKAVGSSCKKGWNKIRKIRS